MFFLVSEFCDTSSFPGGGGRDTVISLRLGGKGVGLRVVPISCCFVVDF